MRKKLFAVAASILGAVALSAGAGNQIALRTTLRGVINDFTPASVGGPWEVRGPWSLVILGRHGEDEGKADFSAALTMERSDLGVMQNGGGDLNNPADRMAHTHHITLAGGNIQTIPGGIEITGPATVTANGAWPPPFGSTLPILTIDITGATGENSVTYSNITLVFGQPAAGHFGTQPVHGVVRSSK